MLVQKFSNPFEAINATCKDAEEQMIRMVFLKRKLVDNFHELLLTSIPYAEKWLDVS